MMHRLPRATRFVQVFRIGAGAHQVRDLVELDMDPVALTVRVGAPLLLRRQRHLGGAMTLAHRATSLSGGQLLPLRAP